MTEYNFVTWSNYSNKNTRPIVLLLRPYLIICTFNSQQLYRETYLLLPTYADSVFFIQMNTKARHTVK